MTNNELENLGKNIFEYCNKYDIPLEKLFDILEDQKVIPMIRGKALEYNAVSILKQTLSESSWIVQKLNLNPQPGFSDEDISITHRKTGIVIKVESKSAVRGSLRDGKKGKILKEPHFKVKSHKSRSSLKLASTSNDRYSVDEFDVIITNPSNALFKGNTIGDDFEIISNDKIKEFLYEFYNSANDLELIKKVYNDWRFVLSIDIAENGFIPRTPFVKLKEDENWRPINEIESKLIRLVNEKRARTTRRT